MGFFDDLFGQPFGGMFDFNGDGNLSALETAAEVQFFMEMDKSMRRDQLRNAGLDPDELEQMDEYDRRTVLENAGLDPFDFELENRKGVLYNTVATVVYRSKRTLQWHRCISRI